jgi:hypothetical protein
MTVKYQSSFYNSLPASFDGLFDWDFLLPAFNGTKIEPTDIDACIERYGKFLFLETKNPGKTIPQGQVILYDNLLKIGKGLIHVIILYGKTESTVTGMEIWGLDKRSLIINKKLIVPCVSDDVLKTVSSWFLWANNRWSNSWNY